MTFGMETLAQLAEADGGAALAKPWPNCPSSMGYGSTLNAISSAVFRIARRETGERLIAEMETAKDRIAERHRAS